MASRFSELWSAVTASFQPTERFQRPRLRTRPHSSGGPIPRPSEDNAGSLLMAPDDGPDAHTTQSSSLGRPLISLPAPGSSPLNRPKSVPETRVPAEDPEQRASVNLIDLDEPEDTWKEIYEDFTTIDWMRDFMRDHRRQNKIKLDNQWTGWEAQIRVIFDATQSWILISIVGVTIGVIASWIAVVAAWLTDARIGYCRADWYLTKSVCCAGLDHHDEHCSDWIDWSTAYFGGSFFVVNLLAYVLMSTVFATLCSIFVVKIAPYATGSGTPEIKTILGGFIIKGFFGLRTLIVKTIGLPLTVASGLAVGKEGPMIHAACCVGNIFPRFFPKYHNNEGRLREILSAASAAGVAVAFGAPIGGVLFSLEELSSYFPSKTMVRSFFCALVSCVTLQIIDPYRGKRVMYQVTYSRDWYFFEVVFFLLIGLFGGLCGALLIHLNLRVQAFRKHSWLQKFPITEVAVLSAATGFVFYLNMFTRIDSSELLEYLFKECAESDFHGLCDDNRMVGTLLLLGIALVTRMALTTVTFGVKVPAGIFIPSMVIGALFGRILGILVQAWHRLSPDLPLFAECHPERPCVTPGMYALLGAIATLGGVTRMTVSLTVVMFELTGTLDYILPCMITLMVAKLVGDAFQEGGIADILIRVNKFPFLDHKEDSIIGVAADEVMTPIDELVCFPSTGMRISSIEKVLSEVDYKGFPVVKSAEDDSLIGYISRSDLKYALEKAKTRAGIGSQAPVFFDDVEVIGNLFLPRGIRVRSTGASSSRMSSGESAQSLDLTTYVDRTPLSVQPEVPAETVMDLFKKVGPRYILVKRNGRLRGIITKKDLLTALHGDDEGWDKILASMRYFEDLHPYLRFDDSAPGRASMDGLIRNSGSDAGAELNPRQQRVRARRHLSSLAMSSPQRSTIRASSPQEPNPEPDHEMQGFLSSRR
ncbi:putative voltage-gated chloride channel [Polychytrium aggregatum]|uniref:putative voltage-gated chloride channel n=1 Tax=Polychytrium aggregatum TaxID=110093 RepID=UPI0022FE8145|nr:putative voltage-gated chloride channel [Polychytrium aggregatum]KAI9206915.1 putative voltage-gated chloride channel [Polychytrium aggregatum]